MAKDSVFLSLVGPLKQKHRLLPFSGGLRVSKTAWESVVSWALFLNTVITDLQLVLFTFRYAQSQQVSLSIITGSIATINILCTCGGLFVLFYRTDFRSLLKWCESQHELENWDGKRTQIVKRVLELFFMANLLFIKVIFVASTVVNLALSNLQTTYFIHLPGLEPKNLPLFLLNQLSQALGCWYHTLLGLVYLASFFIPVKYIYETLNLMIGLVRREFPDKRTLRTLVKMHQDVMEAFKILARVGSEPFLAVQVTLFPLVFLGYFAFYIEARYRIYAFAISTFSFEVFAFFFCCELLTSKFEEFYTEIYSIQWYEATPRDRKYLIMILAQRVPKIRGGGIFPVTLEMFLSIIKKVYSACLVLASVL